MPEHEQKQGKATGTGPEGAPASAFDPAGLDAAEAQAAELAGAAPEGKGSAEKQAQEAAEKARLAKAEASWKKFLGEKLGAKAFEQVHKQVGYAALQGYAKKGVDGLAKAVAGADFFKPTEAGALGGLMDEAAEAEALNKLVAALEPEIKALALKLVESEIGQKLLKSVADWTEEHPVTVTTILTTLLIGGAVAAYLANMEIPELEKTFKIGKTGLALEVGAQLGKLQEISLKAITVGIKYEADGLKASLKAVHDSEDGTSVTASVSAEGGKGDTTGKASLDVTVSGESEIEVKASGALKTIVSGHDVTASAGATHSSKDDKTRVEGKVVLGKDGETRSVSGHYSPTDGSFKLAVGQTALDGKVARETSVGRDDKGQMTSEESLIYKPNEDTKLSVSQGTKGGQETFSLGAAFDIGKFETKLDLDMEGAKTKLGVGGAYDVDNYRFSLHGDYSLSDRRLGELGASVGWRDPKAFKSWSLGYKAKYQADNPGYEHTFDTALEYSMGQFAGRLRGQLEIDKQGVSGGEVDALGGYRVGKSSDWQILGGVNYDADRGGAGQIEKDWSVRGGIQYKGVGVTVGRRFESGDNFIQLEIPLLRW